MPDIKIDDEGNEDDEGHEVDPDLLELYQAIEVFGPGDGQ
jgi:hypothetical protein